VETFEHARKALGFQTELHLLCRDPEAWARRAPHLAASPAIRLHPGGLLDFQPPAGPFDGLIHMAVDHGTPGDHERQAVDGARRILDLAGAAGVSRLLFTSSGAVYGPATGPDPLGEDRPVQPVTDYGRAKGVVEELFAAHAQARGAEAVLARCFAFVGPGLPLDANYAIGNFLRDALAGQPIRIQGDGTPLRSYLHGADLAIWLWTLYFRGPSCLPVNVGSDQPCSIRELATRVAAQVSPGLPVEVLGQAVPGVPPPSYLPAIHRARALCGLEVRIGLDEAIQRTAEWHRAPGVPAP